MQKNKFNQSIEDINDFFSLLEFIDSIETYKKHHVAKSNNDFFTISYFNSTKMHEKSCCFDVIQYSRGNSCRMYFSNI